MRVFSQFNSIKGLSSFWVSLSSDTLKMIHPNFSERVHCALSAYSLFAKSRQFMRLFVDIFFALGSIASLRLRERRFFGTLARFLNKGRKKTLLKEKFRWN
jgi:hypothetical protein